MNFQHDSDHKCTANAVKTHMDRKTHNRILSDLNTTEAIWDHVDREHRTILEDYFKKLQESLPKRVQTVLKNEGGRTKHQLSSWLEL